MVRSEPGISAILARTSFVPSIFWASGSRRDCAFDSLARSRIASFSSSVKVPTFLAVAVLSAIGVSPSSVSIVRSGMTVRLGSWGADRFSETARMRRRPGFVHIPCREAWSREHHLHAVGRDDRTVSRPVPGWRLADDLPEHPAERPQAGEADVEADVGHAAVGLAEQEHRALDPPPLQIAVRCLSEHTPEAADEMRRRHVSD